MGSWWDIAPSHGLSGRYAPLTGHLGGERRVESVSSRARVVDRGPRGDAIVGILLRRGVSYFMSIVNTLGFVMRFRDALDIAQRPFQPCGYCSRAGCPVGYFGDPRPDHTRKVPGR